MSVGVIDNTKWFWENTIQMKAVPIIRRRVILAANAFVEVVIWRLLQPLPPSGHEFKFRLAYVVNDECVLRYDNERGKGDHRHVGNQEFDYVFKDPDRLMQDFYTDVERWNHEHSRS